jgi:hypothetical protein
LKIFRVRLGNGTFFDVDADFITASTYVSGAGTVRFWQRGAHWYSRRRLVAVLDWSTAYSVCPVASDAEIAQKLGVKL